MGNLHHKLKAIRRELHMNPELGNHEYKTARLIERELKNLSIKTKRIGKTGVVGILHSPFGLAGKCFALRADMDALPIQTQIKKSYASRVKNCMHACGHDGNMSIVLGAARVLAEMKDAWFGSVKFIFQPNEESAGGALHLIKEGVLTNPAVDAVIGVHVNSQLPSGCIGLKRGRMMASVDQFIIEIIGEGGHGAYPHAGKDAITIAMHVIQAIQTFVSRCVDTTDPVVITVGKISGGERFNILAERVRLEGTVRCLSKGAHAEIPKRLNKLIAGQVRAWGGTYTWRYDVLGETLVNNDDMIRQAYNAGSVYPGRFKIMYLDKPSMGGEDFAEYLRIVPGCFIYVGTKKNKESSYAWHHPKFDIDEEALPVGSRFLAEMARRFLSQKK
ncbi:MAG: M20 family metallopeptidase [bacterium]